MRLSILLVFLLCISTQIFSIDYVFTGPGDWEDDSLWSPSYPGLIINAGDNVTINGMCTVNSISSVRNDGSIVVEGEIIINGPAIFVNFLDATMNVNGSITINKTMYNQGMLTINGDMFITDLFLNFEDIQNNGTIHSNGGVMNSSGAIINSGTYIDNAGFFEQGTTSHEGVWEGTADHMNDDFIGNGGILSPNGSDAIGDYTFFSDVVGDVNLYLELSDVGDPGIDYDNIVCLNQAYVDNFGLEVSLIDGFNPQIGDSFILLTADSGIVGDLSDPMGNLPDLDAGLEWAYANDGNAISITVQSALAINLTLFEVEASDKGMELRWETCMEIDHDHFRIEKSKTGLHWNEIGRVEGSGQSYELIRYEFLDNQPFQGDNCYRLVAIDHHGQEDFSSVIHVTNRTLNSIRIWPSIFALSENKVMYVTGLIDGIYQVSIMNSIGQHWSREVYLEREYAELLLSQTLVSGYYFIQIQNETLLFTDRFYID